MTGAKPPNLFHLPDPLPTTELFESVLQQGNVHIERILSTGQITPVDQWYDQPQGEWVLLLQGEAVLVYADGSEIGLKAGDHVWIPPHCKHRVAYTSTLPPCLWVAVHVYQDCD